MRQASSPKRDQRVNAVNPRRARRSGGGQRPAPRDARPRCARGSCDSSTLAALRPRAGSFVAMGKLKDGWRRFGQFPALLMVCSIFALALLAALVLDDVATMAVGVALLAAFVLYCFARPQGGADVFGIAAVPAATATILHDIFGTPRWPVLVVLVPLALLWLWAVDRDRRLGPSEPADGPSTADDQKSRLMGKA